MANLKDIGGGVLEFVDSTIDRLGSQNRAFSTAEEARAAAMLANVSITEERERRAQDRKDKNQALLETSLYVLLGVAGFAVVAYLFVYLRKNIN